MHNDYLHRFIKLNILADELITMSIEAARKVTALINKNKGPLAAFGLTAALTYGGLCKLQDSISVVDEKGLGWRAQLVVTERDLVFSLRIRNHGINATRCDEGGPLTFTTFDQISDEIRIGVDGINEKFYRHRVYPKDRCNTPWD